MARSNLRVALSMRSLMMVLLLFMFLYWSCSYVLCSAEPTMFLDTGCLRLQVWRLVPRGGNRPLGGFALEPLA